ncbi:Protein of unknown function [Pyronema omphalodes CBS 100304]|uniref:Uncharacterized protein n=1 Tax=Pyronema omphalodes (strain CBS 100304) TaxID=1076935 RepID=U4KUD8_PYROM|nr:Protein of unknown function [Pyronema omphalodes CBS 100304]
MVSLGLHSPFWSPV